MQTIVLKKGVKGIAGVSKKEKMKIECPECSQINNFYTEFDDTTETRKVILICKTCGCVFEIKE